jgi:hypothetical protein
VSHTYIFVIDHVEEGRKGPPMPAQVEGSKCE